MALELTEELIVAMAPAEKTVLEGRGLIKKGAFRALGKSEDGSLVFGDCQGSGAQPYKVSLDLDTGSERPTTRCTCPSRQFPCKHAVGLMLAFTAKGDQFKIVAPPADLLAKRAKIVARVEKDKSADGATAAAPKARVVNKAAQAKKAEEQAEALDTLEKFLLDLVSAGLGGVNAKSVKAVEDQARRMGDADLQGARGSLLRLAALATAATARARKAAAKADDDDADLRLLTDEDRQARMIALVTQLWTTVRKGRKALEGKGEEGESRSEADAHVESILGKKWQLTELREAGYWTEGRTLVELAHERVSDPVVEMELNTGYLLDLGDGAVHLERSMIPYQALKIAGVKHRISRAGVLAVKEAALYPGAALNHRIRWDDKAAVVTERERTADDYAQLHAHAKALEPALKAFREQLKNPLAGSEAVVLLAAASFGLTADDTLVMVDAAGARLAFRDPRDTQYATTENLRHAAGAFGPGSVAVRLWYDLAERSVFGQALALIVGDKHLRLGL